MTLEKLQLPGAMVFIYKIRAKMTFKVPDNLLFYESKNMKDSKHKRRKASSCSLDKWVSGNILLKEDSPTSHHHHGISEQLSHNGLRGRGMP